MRSRKPNGVQVETIRVLKNMLDYWSTTNDLASPSHYTDVESEIGMIEFDNQITPEQEKDLVDRTIALYESIKQLNPDTR